MDDNLWPRPFPYPDELLCKYHEWWDARNPVPLGLARLGGWANAVKGELLLLLFGTAATSAWLMGWAIPSLGFQLWELVRNYLGHIWRKKSGPSG